MQNQGDQSNAENDSNTQRQYQGDGRLRGHYSHKYCVTGPIPTCIVGDQGEVICTEIQSVDVECQARTVPSTLLNYASVQQEGVVCRIQV